jgi:DNA-binding NarL/FixJ family response regulator
LARSSGEIAGELFVSEGTVKTHVNHLFTKLRLRDRAAAVVFAYDHDLVTRD